jgi:hypothetical protein
LGELSPDRRRRQPERHQGDVVVGQFGSQGADDLVAQRLEDLIGAPA